jgi:hypothetical protein
MTVASVWPTAAPSREKAMMLSPRLGFLEFTDVFAFLRR